MSRWDELEKAAQACLKFTTGEWLLYVPEGYKGPDSIPSYGVEDINGNAIVWADLVGETGVAQDVYAVHITLANPNTVLTMIEQNRELLEALRAIRNEVEGNIEPTVRDLVNQCGRSKPTDPNEIYEYCERIEEIIEAAIRKATGEE